MGGAGSVREEHKVALIAPIKSLYEQGRVHHVGTFGELEAEMVQWIPDESSWSPNRLDALVWAITELTDVGQPALWFV